MAPVVTGTGETARLVRESQKLIEASTVLRRDLKQVVAEINCRMATTEWLLAEFDDIMACPPCARAVGDDRPLPGRDRVRANEGEAMSRVANDNWPVKMPRAT